MAIILEKFKQEWIIEGRLEEQQEINRHNSKSMLQKGLNVQLISEITGLSISEIQALKDKDE
jgi:predicted transposase YdaD